MSTKALDGGSVTSGSVLRRPRGLEPQADGRPWWFQAGICMHIARQQAMRTCRTLALSANGAPPRGLTASTGFSKVMDANACLES